MELRNEKGITLVELMVAFVLLSLITITVYNLYLYAARSMQHSTNKLRDRQRASFASKLMERDIREIEESAGFESISLANANNLIFYSDFDNDEAPEKVEYILTSGILYRKVTEPDSNDPPYTYTGTQKTATACLNVTNNQMFRYFSEYETELTSLPLSAAQRQTVKLIKISISVDSTPGELPPGINLETDVNLRNQK